MCQELNHLEDSRSRPQPADRLGRGGYVTEYVKSAYVAPSCFRMPSSSMFIHSSTILPSATRLIVIPLTLKQPPLDGMSGRSFIWQPENVKRVTTLSPSSIWSSM